MPLGTTSIDVTGGSPVVERIVLPIPSRAQLTWLWCWAALAVSVDQYFDTYHGSAAPHWTQCALAETLFGLSAGACCRSNPPGECVRTFSLEVALKTVDHLSHRDLKGASAEAVMAALRNGSPVGVRKRLGGGGHHAVLITGFERYQNDFVRLVINDPAPGTLRAWWAFSEFPGTNDFWTHTYYTRP
jgi:hypothetical protein